MPLADGQTFRSDPMRTYLIAQLMFLGSALFGAALYMIVRAVKERQIDHFASAPLWLGSIGTIGFAFWFGCAVILGPLVWHLRSWFWASTYVPSLIAFPLIWWWMSAFS